MTQDRDGMPDAPPRRIFLRRRGGFSAGTSTRSESLRTAAEPDEVDNIVDVDTPTEFRGQARRGALPAPVAADNERDNPRSRLNAVNVAGSSAYAKEYRLTLLHRMLMRRVPLDQIASQLHVSISTIEKDRVALKKMLREDAKSLNIEEMVGGQQAVYDEIAGMAMRIASAQGEGAAPTPMRLAAMRTALAANADRARFLQNAGVFDVLRFRKTDDGSSVSDVQMLMQRTAEMLQQLAEEEQEPGRRPTDGGFAGLSFDDADASSGNNEMDVL